MTPTQKERLYECARQAYALGEAKLRSASGADQADSEVHFCERRVYVDVASGTELEEAIAKGDVRWRRYAAEQAEKVASAPKVKHGPMSGHSVISHRWVNPDAFQSKAIHIRAMVKISIEKP